MHQTDADLIFDLHSKYLRWRKSDGENVLGGNRACMLVGCISKISLIVRQFDYRFILLRAIFSPLYQIAEMYQNVY